MKRIIVYFGIIVTSLVLLNPMTANADSVTNPCSDNDEKYQMMIKEANEKIKNLQSEIDELKGKNAALAQENKKSKQFQKELESAQKTLRMTRDSISSLQAQTKKYKKVLDTAIEEVKNDVERNSVDMMTLLQKVNALLPNASQDSLELVNMKRSLQLYVAIEDALYRPLDSARIDKLEKMWVQLQADKISFYQDSIMKKMELLRTYPEMNKYLGSIIGQIDKDLSSDRSSNNFNKLTFTAISSRLSRWETNGDYLRRICAIPYLKERFNEYVIAIYRNPLQHVESIEKEFIKK